MQPDGLPEPGMHELEVSESMRKTRLDVAIAERMTGVSRSAAQKLIKDGRVTVNGRKRPQGFCLETGMIVAVDLPPRDTTKSPSAESADIDVIYEDDHLLVINKRPGLVVHPGAGHRSGTLVNQLLGSGRSFSDIAGEDRPGLVHRLDKDTSGALLIAKTNLAHESLTSQFKERTVHKTYLALVLGASLPDSGTIDTAFGRRPGDRKQYTGRIEAARRAVTVYETLLRGSLCALVAAHPKTGRTHQIRVHMAEAGHPIVGDRIYGRAFPRPGSRPQSEVTAMNMIKRHALHAWSVSFLHPVTGARIEVKAPLPRDFRHVLEALFGPDWSNVVL